MKRLIIIVLLISTSVVTAQKTDPIKELNLIESPDGSAESANSDTEYKRVKPRLKEAVPIIKSAPSFYRGGHPWIRSKVSRDARIGFKLAALAIKWLKANKRTVKINGKRRSIYNDCCHFVRALYWHVAGVDILYEPIRTGAAKKLKVDMTSGCAIVYSYMKVEERTNRTPRVGDVIFFDNTWDRNRNRRWDDPLTHVGIVTDIAPDSTVTFVHANTGRPKRIRKAYLNMKYPNDRKRNTYLKVKYRWDRHPRQLAGQITRIFGGFPFSSSKLDGSKKSSLDTKDKGLDQNYKDKSREPERKSDNSGLFGTWKLKFKNKRGIHSYMFKKTILKFNSDNTGMYKKGRSIANCRWAKKGKSITLYIKGKAAQKFEIIRISNRELYLSTKDRYRKRIELMFNKQ